MTMLPTIREELSAESLELDIVDTLERFDVSMPAPTCPQIDEAIAALENLRSDNAQLRDGICHAAAFCQEAAAVIRGLRAQIATHIALGRGRETTLQRVIAERDEALAALAAVEKERV